jgi:hypothetical protein
MRLRNAVERERLYTVINSVMPRSFPQSFLPGPRLWTLMDPVTSSMEEGLARGLLPEAPRMRLLSAPDRPQRASKTASAAADGFVRLRSSLARWGMVSRTSSQNV